MLYGATECFFFTTQRNASRRNAVIHDATQRFTTQHNALQRNTMLCEKNLQKKKKMSTYHMNAKTKLSFVLTVIALASIVEKAVTLHLNVCLFYPGSNPRPISLFVRNTFKRYGSSHHYAIGALPENCSKHFGAKQTYKTVALVSPQMIARRLEHPSLPMFCDNGMLCIIIGDEECEFNPVWAHTANIIFRQ